MSKFSVKINHIPNLKEYSIGKQQLQGMLEPLGLKTTFLWDRQYYYVCHTDWGKVFSDVLQNMPKYTTNKFDCENFALLTSARISEKYKLNACGIAIGQSPWGYHGFNIFLSDAGLFYLEPQNAMVYSVEEESGYKAEAVILG